MRIRDRARIWATPVLLAIAIGLAIALAAKMHYLSRSELEANKDWLSTASTVVGAGAILVTAVLAYFRFFRGRTFASRAILDVAVTVLTAPHGDSLHTVVTKVSNVGTTPIWDPQVNIEITELQATGEANSRMLQAVYKLAGTSPSDRYSINVLDSAETADFVCQPMIDQDVWAVTYLITLRSAGKDAWSTVCAVQAHDPQPQIPTLRALLWRWAKRC
jgi:hypothetical protein